VIDNFSLGLTHVLMFVAALLLMRRRDLDDEPLANPKDAPGA
jgi:hypothetical protein